MIRTPTPSELGSKRREKTCRGGGTKPSDKGSLTPTSYLKRLALAAVITLAVLSLASAAWLLWGRGPVVVVRGTK